MSWWPLKQWAQGDLQWLLSQHFVTALREAQHSPGVAQAETKAPGKWRQKEQKFEVMGCLRSAEDTRRPLLKRILRAGDGVWPYSSCLSVQGPRSRSQYKQRKCFYDVFVLDKTWTKKIQWDIKSILSRKGNHSEGELCGLIVEFIEQGSANCSLWAKSCCLAMFVNKVLFEHSCNYFGTTGVSSFLVTIHPADSKLPSLNPFTKKSEDSWVSLARLWNLHIFGLWLNLLVHIVKQNRVFKVNKCTVRRWKRC